MKSWYLTANLKKSAMYTFLSAYLWINRNTIKRHFKWKDVLDMDTTITYINKHIVPKIELSVNWKKVDIKY